MEEKSPKTLHPIITEKHLQFGKKVREFAEKELAPHADEWEEKEEFPSSIFPRLAELGFLGLRFPKKYAGQNLDFMYSIIFSEELAHSTMGGVTTAVSVQNEMVAPPVFKFGTEQQRQRFLVAMNRGLKIGALGVTEPKAGSDVAAIQTNARKDGNSWVINGEKIFITNGYRADFILVVARTSEQKGYKGISLFLVESNAPGFTRRKLHKVTTVCSDAAHLHFDNCQVPAENMIGDEGKGFYHIMWELQGERIAGAANAVGRAQVAFEAALKYAQQREQFGHPLAHFQVIQHKLADMATEIEVTRQFVYYVAWLFENGVYPVKEISMAKLMSSQVANSVADEALQIHGGHGLLMDSPAQRYWRDCRLSRIGGGTDEIQKEIIARSIIPKAKE
ncbi:MAG: acyl-CoA dehydrogenase [Chloroflexi bacterium]|nr:acyl-CoA dehydrogenase [Chloroflexota bacterium]